MSSETFDAAELAQVGVDLFSGALNPAVGRAYARLASTAPDRCELAGTLIGPTCLYAATLPLTARFVDRGPGGPPLAEVVVPEPCYWTPAMPQLYRAELQLSRNGQVLAEYQHVFGFRPLGTSGARLRLDGKNWVLRGVRRHNVTEDELRELHEDATCLVIGSPSDEVCAAASTLGVLIVAELDSSSREEIRRLARWPAVGIVSLPAEAQPDLAGVGHNLLVAERLADNAAAPSQWADLAIVSPQFPHLDALLAAGRPVIAARRPYDNQNSDRASADRLQAELSAHGLLAGYIG